LILRILFPVACLLLACFAIITGSASHAPDSALCRSGGCEFSQMYDEVAAAGVSATNLKALLLLDPANPDQWCAYAEWLRLNGDVAGARAAYLHATELGPGLASVRMRVVNFLYANGYPDDALRLVPAILSHTPEFDEPLFSYAFASGKPPSDLLGAVVPAEARPALAWMNWLQGQDQADVQLGATWSWLRSNQLLDETTAMRTVNTVWQRGQFRWARNLWTDWMPAYSSGPGQMLGNASFQQMPHAVPFDWEFPSIEDVEYIAKDGLNVHFLGRDNIQFRGVRQYAAVTPGRYRFSAEISADGLSTDQGPQFEITDALNASRLGVQSPQFLGSVKRSTVQLEFVVKPTTGAIVVQLIRKPSLKFDSRISGTLHIYSTSLMRVRNS